jgi:hypothetical protein
MLSAGALEVNDAVIALHIAAGSLALTLGAIALIAERPPAYRSRAGTGYVGAVVAVAITAISLVALGDLELWWLVPLALFTFSLAVAGYMAPDRRRGPWIRFYAHGQGGAYVALVTALLVVSLSGSAATAAWIIPTVIGLPLIELRVSHIREDSISDGRNRGFPVGESRDEGDWRPSAAP